MAKLVAVGKWMSKWFTALVVLWAAVNYLVPQMSAWVIPNTSYLLGIILFGMGLTLTGADFKRIAQHPVPVVLGTLAHYVIMPGLAFLLCLVFHLKGATAAGVILVGSCPSGTSSSVMAYLAGGDVALDVCIETLSTLLAPVALPGLLLLLANRYVEIPTASLFLSTARIVLIPIVLGVVVHTLFKKQVDRLTQVLPLVSQLAILLIIGAVVSANHANIFTAATALVIPVVMLHNLAGYSLGLFFSYLIRLRNRNARPLPLKLGCKIPV